MQRISLVIFTAFLMLPRVLAAQTAEDVVWLQIEARPSYAQALERLETYAETLDSVKGFAITGGWFAIAVGPFAPEDAEEALRSYRLQGVIPNDSYIALSSSYGQQYWPPGEDILALGNLATITEVAETPATATEEAPTSQVQLSDTDTETPAQSRRSESILGAEERRELQQALQWAGFYNSTIDGSFGRGTRRAMAAWQVANGFEATGVLTTLQRAALVSQYNAILDGLDMELVRDVEAGIEIRLPTGAVAFEKFDPPFAHYTAFGELDATVLLVSQAGDRSTLNSLYDIMQTLRVIPLNGPRQLNRNSFSIVGQGSDFISETEVALADGEIKGFTLIWPTGDEQRRARVLQEMRNSIVRRSGVIDATQDLPDELRTALIAGLEVRQPTLSRSGFYVDGTGAVVTSAETVQNCDRITLDDTYDVKLASLDENAGVAILVPTETLAPPSFARFSRIQPDLQSEVAVAGYSFEGQLGAPSVTFGRLADLKGLGGEPELSRLSLPALPGDVGGPVMDETGSVIGVLLPTPQSSRQLPQDVRFALSSSALTNALAQAGVEVQTGEETANLAPEDVASRGAEMTVLISCWE